METIVPLGERGLDALKELFNIGAGSAATSLSQMLGGEKVQVEVPNIETVPTSRVGHDLGGAHRVVCAVGFTITGGLEARLLFVLEESSARRLAAVLLGKPLPSDAERAAKLDPASLSALEETGNIVASSFVSGLGKLTNRRIMPSVPNSGFADAGTVVESVLARLGRAWFPGALPPDPHAPSGAALPEESIVCRTDFTTRGTRIQGHLLLMPERHSLSNVLEALGIDPNT